MRYWRTGRKVGRTIYIHDDPDDDGDGQLVGLMDTPELAAMVVDALNRYERLREALHHIEREDAGTEP